MSKQEQDGRALAAIENRTIAAQPSGNSLVARGLADLSDPVEASEATEETVSVIRRFMMALVHNAAKRLVVKHGQGPVLEEIAAECGLAVEAIIGIQRNFFADPLYAGHRRALSVASRTCSYREREVLKLLYGFGDGYTYTRDEVAHFFKESAEVIRQVERDGIGRILAYLEDKGWDRYAQW